MTSVAGTSDPHLRWHEHLIDRAARRRLTAHRSCVVWFTGLSGAGKSTIANLVEQELHASGHHTYLLDGDNLRYGLNSDLGFSAEDREENVRRVGEVARLMADAGLIVLVCLISPFRVARQRARALLSPDEFIEVFVYAPLAVAEQRDPKGLYRRARSGQIKGFTGIDSPYEEPDCPELRIDTTRVSAIAAAEAVLQRLRRIVDERGHSL